MRDVIIIGGGPAGYTAGIYCARARLYPLVLEGDMAGGLLTQTTVVENFPGFPDGVNGPDLMLAMRAQAVKFGAKLVAEKATSVDFSSRPFKVTYNGETEEAKAIVVATGSAPRKLGVPSESALYGHGVSTCATCDAFFYRGKRVAVVGGGDAALEEADFLTRFADKVIMLVRRDVFRASKAMQERILNNPKIEIRWNTLVDDVLGVDVGKVRGVRLIDAKTNELSEIEVEGFFPIVGHDPNSLIFRGQLDLDEAGYVKRLGATTATSVSGVFVAGDISDHRYRQAITAAGSGCMAALDALHFLENAG